MNTKIKITGGVGILTSMLYNICIEVGHHDRFMFFPTRYAFDNYLEIQKNYSIKYQLERVSYQENLYPKTLTSLLLSEKVYTYKLNINYILYT